MAEGVQRTLKSTETLSVPPIRSKNPLLSDDCLKYLNYRIQQEEYSSRIYLSMSLWLNNEGYTGAAGLWHKYSEEELKHANWSRDYLLAMGIQPLTANLEQPPQTFAGLPDIINQSYDHEVDITKQCNALCADAMRKGDHMLYTLGAQYVKEQIEELDKMQTWKDKLVAFGVDKIALRLLDNEMGG